MMADQQEFAFTADNFCITPEMKQSFDENGYIILRGLLEPDETDLLKRALENDERIRRFVVGRQDDQGMSFKMCLWNVASDDITGMVLRSEKVAGTWEQLLGGEVYLFHVKVTMKEPHVGGAFVWHQDYGYWYINGCLTPEMGTIYIAIDKADKDNGCLEILNGSHKMGRINTTKIGEQIGADEERVKLAQKRFPVMHVELEPGDAVFFHCNLIHRSGQNLSPRRRWGFLGAYNRSHNSPVYTSGHPNASYTPIYKVPNSAILQAGQDLEEKNYFSKEILVESLKGVDKI